MIKIKCHFNILCNNVQTNFVCRKCVCVCGQKWLYNIDFPNQGHSFAYYSQVYPIRNYVLSTLKSKRTKQQ